MKKEVWTAKDIRFLQVLAQDVLSLNITVSNPEDNQQTELGDMVPDDGPGPEEIAIAGSRRDLILELIHTLPPREQKIILMRFGFDDGVDKTLNEVGQKFGVTRERIRQIEAKALTRLKDKLKDLNEEGDL